jgi:Ring finger domain
LVFRCFILLSTAQVVKEDDIKAEIQEGISCSKTILSVCESLDDTACIEQGITPTHESAVRDTGADSGSIATAGTASSSEQSQQATTTKTATSDIEVGGPALQVVEQEPDKDKDNKCADDIVDGECEMGYVLLPCKRLVPNCCAVCLCPYQIDETVVWSSNVACQHAFHQDCMIDWLVKMQNGTPCPCCRQEFTDVTELEKETKKKREWNRTAFNIIESVSLRR